MKRHALVIGGTRGLGRPLVRKWATEGRRVSVLGKRAPAEGDKAVANAVFFTTDLTAPERLEETLSEIVRDGGPVHNLVFYQRWRGEGDAWAGEIGTGPGAVKAVIELLRDGGHLAKGGSVVVIGSAATGFVPKEISLGYQVAKVALEQLVRYFAVDLAPLGVRVNGVCPATTVKEESRQYYASQHTLLEMYRQIVPLGRLGTSEELAEVVSFFADGQSSFVTGQNLVMDGGMSLLWQESLGRKFSTVAQGGRK